ncbi:MAG: DoxX family protein [Gemmatimonadaceae bacterium]
MLEAFLTLKRTDLGLTFLRIVTGVVFAAHGYQKFFTMGIPGVTGFFTQVGAPLPHLSAVLVASIELVGGIALILGLFTRLVAIPLAIDMLMAIVLVHFKNGLTGPMGMELVLVLMSATTALAVAGPGALAIDAIFGGRTVPARG